MSSDSQPSPADRPDPNEGNPALRARVPDHVADGCFSTGAIVMTGPSEFIVDFLQTIGRPHKVASRVVIPHPVMPQFIEALSTNLQLYKSRFGEPPVPPVQNPPSARRPTPQEIYDDLKLPDDVLSGVYANGVMIGHGASEFGLDFLTSFFPQSAVSARVFLAAGQVPRLLDSLRSAVQQLAQRQQAMQAGLAGQTPPEGNRSPENLPPEKQPNADAGDAKHRDTEHRDTEHRDTEHRDTEHRDGNQSDGDSGDGDQSDPGGTSPPTDGSPSDDPPSPPSF